ncbi:hypothetical protein Pmar_PMAR004652, partial [Perkinsus marinus ATCC 50983]
PLRPLKPACPPPPRRPSHSPPRQSFEQRVMDFQSNPVSSIPPPPPPLPVEVISCSRLSDSNSRNSMNWQETTVENRSVHRSAPYVEDSGFRNAPTNYSETPEHHARPHHPPPEIYNERPSPTRAYYEMACQRREPDDDDDRFTYGSGYEPDVSRQRRREYYPVESCTPVEPWESVAGHEHGSSRSHAARQLEFVTQQCVKIYGSFPPKFITKDCVCETCMVGPGRDLPLDSREGLAWTAEHVYVHLKTRITVLNMGTCYPVRK